MRPLDDDEIPDPPDSPGVAAWPWLLRARLILMILGTAVPLGLLARVDHAVFTWVAWPLRVVLAIAVALYVWHVGEPSALGRAAPPRLTWLFDRPSRHGGLRVYLLVLVGAWGTGGLVIVGSDASLAAIVIGGALLAAAPLIVASLTQANGLRGVGYGTGLTALDDLGREGVFAVLLLIAALVCLPIALLAGIDRVELWCVLVAGVLGAARVAGRLIHARAAFAGLETEQDQALAASEAEFDLRLRRLFQRLHDCRETGDVPMAVSLLDGFLAEDGYAYDQRMLYELGEWHWPRLVLEHARGMVARRLAERNVRSAWAMVLEQAPTETEFLPASLADLAQLAEAAAGPGERRAGLAMVRRADRLETVASDDARRARIWLAAAECAWAEGDASATRVWLGRAQTRFPDALAEAERARRVETLRRALESS